MIQKCIMATAIVTGKHDKETLEKEEETKETEQDMTMPAYGSEDWHDYVMSKFHDSEMYNGNPLTVGLRRVAEQLLGVTIDKFPAKNKRFIELEIGHE